jgi:ABC-type multidrug transport system fused ATPase/permease subunit
VFIPLYLCSDRKHYHEKGKLLPTLWKLAAPTYLRGAFWELIFVASRITLPLSLRELLIIVEQSEPGESIFRQSILYAVTLVAAGVIGAIAQNRSVYLSTKSGITIRAALSSVIYEHALTLSPTGRKGLTTGEVTNLVAVDTQKLYDVCLEGQNAWSCPVLIILVTLLLWKFVGPALVLGVVTLILFVPVVKTIVSTMLRIRKERAKLTDTRVNLLTAMLQGIRVTKLNHYEKMVEESVGSVRNQEMKLLRKELRMWGLVLTTAVSSPLLSFFAAVTCYVLVDEENILHPSDAFSALLLFSILRFPINMTARLVGKAAQAIESLQRVSHFLARETREPGPPESKEWEESKPVLKIENGSFLVDASDPILQENRHSSSDSSISASNDDDDDNNNNNDDDEVVEMPKPPAFALREIALAVEKGQLVAVVGRVGAGKTMLLRALLGEIPATESALVEINGKVSYAPQEPFILNTSLRENILFGSAYDKKRYELSLDACCLRQDVQRLGDAGDLTQIGERGVTLSGGTWLVHAGILRYTLAPYRILITLCEPTALLCFKQDKNKGWYLLVLFTQTLTLRF